MKLSSDIKLDFRDVLIKPIHSKLESRSEVNINRSFKFKGLDYEWLGCPVVVSNMDTTGTFKMALELCKFNMLTCIHKHYTIEEWNDFYKENINNDDDLNKINDHIAISCGTSETDLEKLQEILATYDIKFICIDVANGYRESFIEYVKKIRDLYPQKVIIAGNVVTGEMVKIIIESGANIVKVGIGNGSACSTRMKTGIGYPQFSAILECHQAARDAGGYILSDGGCSNPADIVKAFGGGADFVMCGGMFAGHLESGGELVYDKDGNLFKEFYGMSSDTAMNKYAGGVAKYRTSEGLTMRKPYKGPIEHTLLDICGGVRSACTYLNSRNLQELYDNIEFVKVNNIK